jgi:HPt (histidine-containing phosphotransfer) domain-containing protein
MDLTRFLPRFAALARDRIARAMAVASAGDASGAPKVTGDMHSLAGEAGMLGLEAVLQAAIAAESAARRFAAEGGEALALDRALRELEAAVTAATQGVP